MRPDIMDTVPYIHFVAELIQHTVHLIVQIKKIITHSCLTVDLLLLKLQIGLHFS